LPRINVPTLVLHCRDDARVPFSAGEELAAQIPSAKFVPLEGANHIFLADEPARHKFMHAVAQFLGDPPPRRVLPGSLSLRERLDRAVRTLEQNWAIKPCRHPRSAYRAADIRDGNLAVAGTLAR
jgi:hypothetical protein